LQTLGPGLQTASAAPAGAEAVPELPDVPELYPEGMEAPVEPAPPPQSGPAARGIDRPGAPAAPAEEPGSFADAVIRTRAPASKQ
jgi:hypothetical protein